MNYDYDHDSHYHKTNGKDGSIEPKKTPVPLRLLHRKYKAAI